MMNNAPKLMTKKQVADRFFVSVRTVERMVANGELNAIRIRGCVRFIAEDVDKLMRIGR
jgi:excisionase family DNA binding protein